MSLIEYTQGGCAASTLRPPARDGPGFDPPPGGIPGANPAGAGDPNCVQAFNIKGTWPNRAWYYDFGYGSQQFTWTTCAATGTRVAKKGQGLLR